MQTHDWEGEDGIKRYKTEIVADNMIMLGGKGASGSGANFSASEERQQRAVKEPTGKESAEKTEPQPVEEEISIDDLPF